jgi:hypothetical protein
MNLVISKHGNFHVIQSNDINVKQRFFEWADGSEDPEFYGRAIDPREHPPGTVLRGEAAQQWALTSTDDYVWEWRLTEYKVQKLLRFWESQLTEPLAEAEEKALKVLVPAFKKLLG